ncbi:N/A [soil metagenome]
MTRLRRPRSIRHRLLASLLVLLLIGLVGGPLITSWVVRGYLAERADQRLDNVTGSVGGLLSGRERVVVPEARVSELPGLSSLTIVGLDPQGDIVLSTATAGSTIAASAVAATQDLEASETTELERDGRSYLVTRISSSGLVVKGPGGDVEVDVVVAVADRTDDVAVVRRLERTGLGFALVALLVLGSIAALVLRRGLRPLELMADAVDAVTGGSTDDHFIAINAGSGAETARLGLALSQAFRAQRRAEEALRSFVADASHELRTPLTTLSGWLDLYAQGALTDPQERDRAMLRMESEVARMRLLVEELDLLARMDQGRPLDRAPVALVAVLEGVVEDARVVDTSRPITLHAGAEPVVPGDRARLEQIFRNLVGNAAQHTPAGTPIEVGIDTEDGRAVVRVTDRGDGIEPVDLERIFDRFYRAEPSRDRNRGGSGLGLAITRALVDAHGGEVGVESSELGTTFTVRLPLT